MSTSSPRDRVPPSLEDSSASRHWRRLAFNADDKCVRRFLQKVADTVTDGYYPAGGQDPLRHHLNAGPGGLRVMPKRAIPLASRA